MHASSFACLQMSMAPGSQNDTVYQPTVYVFYCKLGSYSSSFYLAIHAKESYHWIQEYRKYLGEILREFCASPKKYIQQP